MKKILCVCWLIALTSMGVQAQLQWGDQGNGTYVNPVLNADYSDPDVIRVGSKYYMVASDFHFLGIQVLESDDLVNWHIISQVFDRFDYPGWDANQHYGGGSWAPSIRFHEGRFYVYFCTYEEGLFMSSAVDPHGPWEPLHCLKEIPKWEDPCPFWDDDGQAYLGRSRHRAGPIIVHRMSPDGRELLDDGFTVYTGPVAEGTKFLKRNGFYYLIIPEGGVGQGWQTVLRAKNIYGPYEKRVVLEQGSTSVNGPHQGALVDTPDGQWWFLHFQETQPRGRVVHMQPARWKDDWPLMGVDIDGNGVGEPVYVWQSPTQIQGQKAQGGAPDWTSDEFDGKNLYWVGNHQRKLKLQWQWNHNPDNNAWSLDERKGWLTMHALKADSLKSCRNMLTQKTVGYLSEATTLIDGSGLEEGDFAGLLCMGKRFLGVGIKRSKGRLSLCMEQDGKVQQMKDWKGKTAWLRVQVDSRNNQHRFFVSNNGRNFEPVGESFSMRMGAWKGTRVGLFCYGQKEKGGRARFDFFHYDVKE
ncbi:MAG: glycoside hydrolase 43 family protein [Prevotella sp.]|nr:glycoside hydrolase 43 family protein [Prevotella sp.]